MARLPAHRHHRLARAPRGRHAHLGRPVLATVVLAVIRDLLMDLDATGDTARTQQAFDDFLATLDNT